MKLRSKINLYSIAMFTILLLLINGSIYFAFSRMMLDSELERVTVSARQTVKGINQSETHIPINDLLRAYMPVNGMIQIVKPDGTRGSAVTSSGQISLRDKPVQYINKEQKKIMKYDGIPFAFVSVPMISRDGKVAELQVTESLVSTAHNLNTLKFVLMAITLFAAIPVLLSARLLSNFITRPITSLIQTMKEIQGSGRYKRIDLPKQSKDELYQMGETFNDMISQLQSNFEKQEAFVSNASHELKTPLTVIEAYANLLKRRGREQPEIFDESVGAIHSEAERMKSMIEQLLLLAKQDEQWDVEISIVDLTSLVEQSTRSFQAGFNREVKLIAEMDVKVRTDSQKLKQLLYILMDNAQKYSDDPIQVSVKIVDHQAVVEILDRGIGIPKADLPKVFDRFYRVDQSRTRTTGGFGLGLPLAKELAEAINAELSLDSIEGMGTTVRISLELAPSH